MCLDCGPYDPPAPDRLTAEDADLFAHDARKPPHDVQTCVIDGCWVCRTWHRDERAWLDQQIERRTA